MGVRQEVETKRKCVPLGILGSGKVLKRMGVGGYDRRVRSETVARASVEGDDVSVVQSTHRPGARHTFIRGRRPEP